MTTQPRPDRPILWAREGEEVIIPLKRDASGRLVRIPVEFGYDNALREADAARRVQAAFASRRPSSAALMIVCSLGFIVGLIVGAWLA